MLIATSRKVTPINPLKATVSIFRYNVVDPSIGQGCRATRLLHDGTLPADTVPFRKFLKDEAKQRKLNAKPIETSKAGKPIDNAEISRWELTVGLEIHAQLNSQNKLFSEAQTSANDHPNKHVAPFDFALPGSQPAFQQSTLLPALRAAHALKCEIQPRSQFDRKHYFYADQPAGYQITQYYQPLAKNGLVTLYGHDGIALEDGEMVEVGIKQVQLEQDTAKTTLQPPSETLLDFNRVSHPLMEIITLPQIHRPQTAAACVKKIQAVLQAVNAISTGMELGGLRADVNVSVRRKDTKKASRYRLEDHGLGQRTEIKNLSSIKAVEDAIIAERNRQISVLTNGGIIEGETRGWTLGASDTVRLRGKEGEVDYRYMPDPDLGPVLLSNTLINAIAMQLPRLPDENVQDLVKHYGLTIKDAKTLVDLEDGDRLDYFDQVCKEFVALHVRIDVSRLKPRKPRRTPTVTIANWVLHEMGGLLSTEQEVFSPTKVPAKDLAYIVYMLDKEKITGRTAKQLFARKFKGDAQDAKTIVEQENLVLEDVPEERYVNIAKELLKENPDIAIQIKEKGQTGKLGFFIGHMMRKGGGKLVAKKAEDTLRQLLELPKQ
ncbi:MAG: hypothetical protein Q9170_004604 [Blastenia crenularia]